MSTNSLKIIIPPTIHRGLRTPGDTPLIVETNHERDVAYWLLRTGAGDRLQAQLRTTLEHIVGAETHRTYTPAAMAALPCTHPDKVYTWTPEAMAHRVDLVLWGALS